MELSPESLAGRRLHELDGLRAVAITLVVFHHTMTSAVIQLLGATGLSRLEPFIASIPSSGVELFFVLSGIVLLRPYLRGERPFRVASYARRRVRRLWPPYLAALFLAGLVYYWTTAMPSWYSREILQPFDTLAWIRQVVLVNFGWPIYNLAWWSLTPETLFYVSACVLALLLAAPRIGRLHMVLGGVGLALLSILWWDPIASGSGVQVGWNVARQFLAYSPCFAVGVILAKYDFSSRVGVATLALGVAYFIASGIQPALNAHIAFALVYGGLVILAVGGTRWLRDLLSHPLPVWLGERSYSLFLVHHSFIYAANHVAALMVPDRNYTYFIVSRGLGLSLGLLGAIALFMLVERRFARGLVTADALWPWDAFAGSRKKGGTPPDLPTVARVES